MPPHPLTNFEIQKYFQNETKFNRVYPKNNLPKIRMGRINLDVFKPIGTHWIHLYLNVEYVTNFDRFGVGVKHIPKKIRKFIGNKNVKISIYRIQTYVSTMYE